MSEPSLAHPVAFALAEASMDDEAVTRSDAEAMAEGERERCRGRTCCLRNGASGSARPVTASVSTVSDSDPRPLEVRLIRELDPPWNSQR